MSHNHINKYRNLGSMLALFLAGVFAVCILSVLLTGANAYSSLSGRDQTAYDRRTCSQYVATKIRQAGPAGVRIESFGTGDALVLSETLGGTEYLTRIYCYDGWMRELFAAAEGSFAPEDGEKVMEAERLDTELADGLLSVEITAGEGEPVRLYFDLRTGGETDPSGYNADFAGEEAVS